MDSDKASFSWDLPRPDLGSIPQATYKSLTQVYDDYSIENREITFRDERLLTSKSLNTVFYKIPTYTNLEEWEARKEYLRKHILICAGLWPMPEKTPLHPTYYHKIDHGDYVVETVTIQTYPGFYLGGNIYRPKDTGTHPAILTPYGHWKYGRLTNITRGSIPGRCINLARQGYVVFAYDMVGYNDTRQVSHQFANDSISRLYGINLLGLQLWNSIRAMDFVLSLPNVDRNKVGITGASGGGTQTYMLTAVDNRFTAAAPVNMVSNNMQGGDLCENAPGLRINTFNVEIVAMAAPKPLLLVSNTHDWTYNTRNTIMPMLRSIYHLYHVDDHLRNEHFDYPHNYNKASREAIYSWFGKWLLHKDNQDMLREKPFKMDSSKDLLAFMNKEIADPHSNFKQLSSTVYHDAPKNIGENWLKNLLKDIYTRQLNHYWPKDEKSLKEFTYLYGTAIEHLIGARTPKDISCKIKKRSKGKNFIAIQLLISKRYKNEWIPCILYQPLSKASATVILTSDKGKMYWVEQDSSMPNVTIENLLRNNFNVLVPDLFKEGEHVLQDSTMTRRDRSIKYFTTYNLTDRQEQIQDILTIIKALKENKRLSGNIDLWATGHTGMTALLLAPVKNNLNKIAIDGNKFDPSMDENMLKLQIPGIMRIGGLKTILALTSVKDVQTLLYNANPKLVESKINKVNALTGSRASFSMTEEKLKSEGVISFLKDE